MRAVFHVDGLPIAQGSKRHVGGGVMVESSKKLPAWRKAIKAEASRAYKYTLVGGIGVRVTFYFPRPKTHWGTGRNEGKLKEGAPQYHRTYPDLDKLLRALFDGLTSSGLILDDKHVVWVAADKQFGEPGMSVEVWELA